MPIPDRNAPGDYHYHVYGYGAAVPYQAHPINNRGQFYSLSCDLAQLVEDGKTNGVPGIKLVSVGGISGSAGANAGNFGNASTLCLRLGNNPDNPSVVLTGGIHAREWIAPEITYLIAEYLIKHYNQNTVIGSRQYQLSNLINTRNIYIIPMLNPIGNFYSVNSADANSRMWRKNRRQLPNTKQKWRDAIEHPPFTHFEDDGYGYVNYSVPAYGPNPGPNNINIECNGPPNGVDNNPVIIGVDCNRNFNSPNWGYQTLDRNNNLRGGNPTDELYFGTQGNSEVETKNLISIVNKYCKGQVATSIDYHSYGQYIIIPDTATYSHKSFGWNMQTLIQQGGYVYTVGSTIQTLRYMAFGSVMDYMHQTSGSCSFTIELPPAAGDAAGFSLPEDQIMSVFESNIRPALALIATAGVPQNAASFAAIFNQFNAWNVTNRGNQLPL